MMDVIFIVGTLVFFGLSWWFAKLCDRV